LRSAAPCRRRSARWSALHLLRPDGPGRVPHGQGRGRKAAPAHRAVHRHLPVRGRDPSPGQPRHDAADRPRRRELDDGGQGDRPLRADGGAPAGRAAPAVRDTVLGRPAA
jgi:hypothetical protein